MQKKKELELTKQNKKKIIAVENLPTLGNFSNLENINMKQTAEEENNNLQNKIEIQENCDDTLIKQKTNDENKNINIGSLISNAKNDLNNDVVYFPNAVIVPSKKGNKKAVAKKKFVNLDFGSKLGFQKEEEDVPDGDDMLEEDILFKNLANKKSKEIKKSTLKPKGKK